MNKICMLDCTLRDGGYCNQWEFGYQNIKKIIKGLIEADIEIVECGFLSKFIAYNPDVTKYDSVEKIGSVIPYNREGKMFVAMINYGEYRIEDLPQYDGNSIDGIRVAFHKKDLEAAISLCDRIKEKGYKVFVQPMVSLSYSDEEFLSLICRVNKLQPYAFYIVDSFGMMKNKDLLRLFYMVEHNLHKDVWIGFHSHNNMQLAYSNAQTFVGVKTNRNLIVDSSVYGMGRGAGNLNTELFIDYLNDNYNKKYELKPVLAIIDDILNYFYQQNYWGYSLPNYISAVHNAHPNYASFLDDKKTLTVENMNDIFKMMEEKKKYSYDKKYIEEIYLSYMETDKVQEEHKSELLVRFNNKTVVLIAPGKSSEEEKEVVLNEVRNNNSVVISINYDYMYIDVDYIFMSNLRRFRDLNENKREKCIVTSNIPSEGVYYQTKYIDLLNEVDSVKDNAGLMAIKFLMNFGIKEIKLVGFDGYSHDSDENYASNQKAYICKNIVLDSINRGMIKVLKEYRKQIEISFLTMPKYLSFKNQHMDGVIEK